MVFSLTGVLSSILFGVCVQGKLSQNSESINTNSSSVLNAQNATSQALVYGYPLTQYVMLAGPLALNDGVNNFFHRRALSTAEDVEVVRPNEDTLYSSLIYDLSHGDVIINLPEIPEDQFHLMTFYDPYGNIIASLGSGYFDEQGQYYLRKRPLGGPIGFDTDDASNYQAYVNSPTTFGVILMRLVLNSTNINALHVYQNETTSQNVSNTVDSTAPYLLDIIQELQSQNSEAASPLNTTEAIMGLLAAFTPYAPSLYEDQARSIDDMLSTAGIINSTYNTPPGVDLGSANATAEDTIQNCLYQDGRMNVFANGWSMISTEYLSPDFGANYDVRAVVARTGYILTKPPNTTYPVWTNASAGDSPGYNGLAGSLLHLAAGEALLYDFVGGQPPLQNPGFWSLTVYSAEGFLIDNSQGTYRLGDRDNLTYPDGTLVYQSSVESTGESDPKPFQILIQAADAAPPANWTSNWLPSPSGGGDFTAWLRFYGTQDSLLSGEYVYPAVTKIAAITNGTSSNGATSPISAANESGTAKIAVVSRWLWVEAVGISVLVAWTAFAI